MPRAAAAGVVVFALLYVLVIANPPPEVGRQLADDEHGLRIRRSELLPGDDPRRPHVRGAAVHRGERVLAHLRAHAGREHGPRGLLPPRRLHRVRSAAADDGLRALLVRAGGEHVRVGGAVARRDGVHRRVRARRPAGPAALEPGPGSSPGAHHDRRVGHRRRPGDRALPPHGSPWNAEVRRQRRDHLLAGVDNASSISTSGASTTRSRGSSSSRSESPLASCSGSGFRKRGQGWSSARASTTGR